MEVRRLTNNIGCMSRLEIETFARMVLAECNYPQRMEWSTAGSLCTDDVIYIDEDFIDKYPYEAKLIVLHEVAHIDTWPQDDRHGELFHARLAQLMIQFMTFNDYPSEGVTFIGVDAGVSGCEPARATLEWINFKRRAKRNGYPWPKQALVDAIKREVRREGILKRKYADAVLEISLDPCGSKVSYKTFDDIPEQDVPCPCGNPDHWMIRYHCV